jgi:hypothetical protein
MELLLWLFVIQVAIVMACVKFHKMRTKHEEKSSRERMQLSGASANPSEKAWCSSQSSFATRKRSRSNVTSKHRTGKGRRLKGKTAYRFLQLLPFLRKEVQMTWYIIFRVWHVHGCLNFETLDAVEVDCIMDALIYAKQRYRLEAYESFKCEACLTMGDINRAKAIARQHDLDDMISNWTDADWKEFVSLPVYGGDQDKYLRTWKI